MERQAMWEKHPGLWTRFDYMRCDHPVRLIALWLLWAVLRAYAIVRPKRVIGAHTLGPQPFPLFTRWFLTSRPKGDATGTPGAYLHHLQRADADRREHNHPWTHGTTLVLRGGYCETRDGIRRYRLPGDRAGFSPTTYHRIVDVLPNTWTLFVAGPKHGRGWGFRGPDDDRPAFRCPSCGDGCSSNGCARCA